MTKFALAAIAAASLMFSGAAQAQQPAAAPPPPLIDWDKIQIKTTDLGNKTYMLEGQGGNITVAVGLRQHHPGGRAVRPAVRQDQGGDQGGRAATVKYLINTHYHGDHTGGNANFAKDGVIIVAHDNIRTRLAAGTINGLTGGKVAPQPADALPKETYFGGTKVVESGGRKAQLTMLPTPTPTATPGSISPTPMCWPPATPSTTSSATRTSTFANGGDVRGMIRALDAYLKVSNDSTKIVPATAGSRPRRPGHVPQHAGDFSRSIKKLFDEGKTEQQVLDLKPLADLDATWGNNAQHAAGHTKNVYQSFNRL